MVFEKDNKFNYIIEQDENRYLFDLNNKYNTNKVNIKYNKLFSLVFTVFILVVVIICAKIYMPNFNNISFNEIIPVFKKDEIGVIYEDKAVLLESPAVIYEDEPLLPVTFIKQYIDKYIMWDENEKILTITTADKVIRMKSEEMKAYINDNPIDINIPVKIYDDVPYMYLGQFKDLYCLDIRYEDNTKLIVIDRSDEDRVMAKINRNRSRVRQSKTIKSPTIVKLLKNKEVIVYKKYDRWSYVRTEKGILGYIKNSRLYDEYTIKGKEINKEVDNQAEVKKIDGNISLLWRQVFNKSSNPKSKDLKKIDGLDIISPTWFKIINEKGDLLNKADINYANWIKENGYQNWALVANSFGDGKLTHKVLSNTTSRKRIIEQLMVFAAIYKLDGINIDFESLEPRTGPYYLQFLRELAPYMKKEKLVLSVDMYVPSNYTKFYNREEVAKVVDYICVMTYDEHWSTCPVSGSVSSLPFVDNGIKGTIEQNVPSNKILMGIPFYMRLWKEKDGKLADRPRAIGMETAKQIIIENEVNMVWLEEVGQYYGEYKKDGYTYKIWIENQESINRKLDIVDKYNLAGIACWKQGMEEESIWEIINEKIKK